MRIESAALCKMHRHLHWRTTSAHTCCWCLPRSRQLTPSLVIQSIYQYFHPSNTKFPPPDVPWTQGFFCCCFFIDKWSADLEMFPHPIFYVSIYLESCCGDSFFGLIYGSFSALGKWVTQQKHALKEGFQQKEDVTPEPKAVTGGIISLLIL